MHILNVTKASVEVEEREELTSGAQGVFKVQLKFSSDWDGLTPVAVFDDEVKSIEAAIVNGIATIPHEVLTTAGRRVSIEVYGVDSTGKLVLPSVVAELGIGPVKKGRLTGTPHVEPTADILTQYLNAVKSADADLKKAQADVASLRADAAAGLFNPKIVPGKAGNFASLAANGTLGDSGKGASDFAPASLSTTVSGLSTRVTTAETGLSPLTELHQYEVISNWRAHSGGSAFFTFSIPYFPKRVKPAVTLKDRDGNAGKVSYFASSAWQSVSASVTLIATDHAIVQVTLPAAASVPVECTLVVNARP